MRCPSQSGESVEAILAYLAGRLERETADELERHFEECAPCREMLLAQSLVWDALEDWKAPPVPPGFDARLFDRIGREEARSGWWSRWLAPSRPFTPRLALAAAAICLLLAVGILFRGPGEPELPPSLAAADSIDIGAIEQAAEDLEMLQTLVPAAPAETDAGGGEPESKIGATGAREGSPRCG
jgi:anti-sigma factor RsiW